MMTFREQFIKHIFNMLNPSGKKKIFYSILNILYIALAVLSVWGFIQSLTIMQTTTFFGGILLLILCGVFALAFVINGVIGQLVLLISSFVCFFNPEERKGNIIAFFIALLSIVTVVVIIIFIL